MKKLIKNIIRESIKEEKQDLQEQLPGQTGAKVCAVICDPAPGQGPQGEHCDGSYIRICNTWTSGCQTPVVGDYMLSHSNMGTTSWRVTKITKYGYPNGKRQRYPTCTYTNVGCTDKNACNYSAGFTQKCNGDNSCCIYEACGDPNAFNYYAGLTNSCKCTDTTGSGYPDCCDYQGCTNPQAPNYMAHANMDDGTCQLPTKYSCSDGQCSLDFNGQYNTEQECLIKCGGCAGPECFYCPGPTKNWSPPTNQGCTTIGSQWSQALSGGIQLYTSMADCETAQSNCSAPDPSDFTTCHCCDGQGNVQVMPGQYGVGKCSSIHNIGASLNPNGWLSHQWYNCKSISEPISCNDNKQVDCYKCGKGGPVMNKFNMSDTISGCPSGWTTSKNPCKDKVNKNPIVNKKENIREDIDRMKGLFNY